MLIAFYKEDVKHVRYLPIVNLLSLILAATYITLYHYQPSTLSYCFPRVSSYQSGNDGWLQFPVTMAHLLLIILLIT